MPHEQGSVAKRPGKTSPFESSKKRVLRENLIDRMNLFMTKGASVVVRSRKEVSYEEISFGVGANQASASFASSLGAWLACSLGSLYLRISSRPVS